MHNNPVPHDDAELLKKFEYLRNHSVYHSNQLIEQALEICKAYAAKKSAEAEVVGQHKLLNKMKYRYVTNNTTGVIPICNLKEGLAYFRAALRPTLPQEVDKK